MKENTPKEKAVLVGVNLKDGELWETEDHLQELALLADTAGAEVVHTFIQRRSKIDPAFYIGKGKCQEIKNIASELDTDLIIFDDDLSPAQARNLEKALNARIIDRTGIILDIFARRARTREAKIEVELAQLNYLLPRLTGHWVHLSRQVGGIGVRGPGETQLESDRRLVRRRIDVLKKSLKKIEQGRITRRKLRRRMPIVSLVGYTNAGKSTLLNSLTNSDVFVEDKLFATLDPAVRSMEYEYGKKIIFTDTVGFIRKLPHHLVASFKSTLEEVTSADLLLNIIDLSHPHYLEQMASVHDVLETMGAIDKPVLMVFNKIDLIKSDSDIQLARERFPGAVFISAIRKIGLKDLRDVVLDILFSPVIKGEIYLEPDEVERFEKNFTTIKIESRKFKEDKIVIRFTASKNLEEQLKSFVNKDSISFEQSI